MDLGTITGSDSAERILPDFQPFNDLTSLSYQRHSEIPPGQSRVRNMADDALDVEIKEEVEVEVSELFVGRPIDERNETIFPTGLILIHDQPTAATGTNLLTYTPLYMNEKGSPSYLQTSTPNSSIIRTKNSEIQFQFMQNAIQTKPVGVTGLSERFHPARRSTSQLSPEIYAPTTPRENNGVEMTLAGKHFPCTSCGMKFCTFVERNEHVLRVHERILCSNNTSQKHRNLPLCRVNICVPTHERIIEIHKKKFLSSQYPGLTRVDREAIDPLAIPSTKPEKIVQVEKIVLEPIVEILSQEKRYKCTLCVEKFINNKERDAHVIAVHEISHKEKRYKCILCDLRFVDNEERDAHKMTVHKDTEIMSAQFLKSSLQPPAPVDIGPHDPAEITTRGRPSPSSECILPPWLAADLERHRKRLSNETQSSMEMEMFVRDTEYLDTDRISLQTPHSVGHSNGNDGNSSHSQTPSKSSSTDDMNTNAEMKDEVKVEVSELFLGRSEEDNETVFPTGLILIHDQPTVTVTDDPDSWMDTHVLTCTPVYNDEKGTPSFLQTSVPTFKPPPSNSIPKDPLEIFSPESNNEVQTILDTTDTDTTPNEKTCYKCTFCNIKFATKLGLTNHRIGVHPALEKIKKCTQCEKIFGSEEDYKKHMSTHSEVKRFLCEKCGANYKWTTGLKGHMKSKHGFDEHVPHAHEKVLSKMKSHLIQKKIKTS